MRKILFILIIVLLVIFTGIVIYKGTNLGSVWGYTQIEQKNADIDKSNEELTKLVKTDYPNALSSLSTSSETMQETKREYEQQAILIANNKYYNQIEKYKIEFLLTKFGNYGHDNNVNVKLDVAASGLTDLYNLTLTVVGKYSDVAGYIYDLENDSKLGFKVEDFSMRSSSETVQNDDGETVSTNAVEGKFTFKEVGIDLKSLDGSSASVNVTNDSQAQGSQSGNNSTQTNATNTNTTNTNTNTNTNTTTTNTTNTNTTATNTTSPFREIPSSQTDMSEGTAVIDNIVGNS